MMKNGKTNDFIGYEYMDVTVPATKVVMYLDCYEHFGWQLKSQQTNPSVTGKVTLTLARNRKLINKMELTRLQRNFEASMEEIHTLEQSQTKVPQALAIATGILGTVFMAGSVFAVTAAPPLIFLCILLAIPGFAGWILPYFLYQSLVAKRKVIVHPLIEQKLDEIYGLCKNGRGILT